MLVFASEALAWKPILIGHRGSRTGVENTEQAFINGVTKHGCQALECDVKVTSDKKYVCWHDDVITTSFGLSSNCTIYTNTLATIQSKTLTQTRKSVKYTGKICTVERYLEICKQYNVTPVVELKWASGINSNDMSNFPGLYALFEKLDMVDDVIILTSMKASLEYIGQNYPKLKCQYLVNYITSSNISTCKSNGWDISSCYYYNSSNYVTQALVDQAHAAGVKVSLWTINSEADYKKYAGYGANYVTTDDFIYKDLPELSGTDPNPAQADVTWVLNGGTVSGTLPTTITSTYTIPTPTKTGYVFLGWYSTNSTSGTKYTTLSAGFKGTVYAVWRETKVTWVLNGGKVYEEQAAVPSNEELMETFKADYNTYFSQSIATTREFSNFLYYGNSIGCDVSKMMTDSKSGWKWLGDYINTVSSAAGVTMSAEVNWRYSLNAFFTCGAAGNYNADFTTAGQPTKWASAYQTAHSNTSGGATTMVEVTLPTRFSSTYTIPTPVKDGYDFVGWYDNANGTGSALKTLPAYYDGTVYAIWKIQDDVKWELHGGYIVGVTLPGRISDAPYTIPTPSRNMHVFLGWYDNEAGTGTPLTVLPVGYKGTVHATWREAKVTWVLNGGKVMKDGAEVTLPTSIKSAYTIPTPEKEGHTFLGWYDTNDTTGTQYTLLTAGHDGTLYAIWKEIKEADVTWVLNGGKVLKEVTTTVPGSGEVKVPTQDELWDSFKTAAELTTLGTLEEIGKTFSTICTPLKLANLQTVFGKAEWAWLKSYIMETQNAQEGKPVPDNYTPAGVQRTVPKLTTELAPDGDANAALWRYAVAAFFLQTYHTGYPATADFSTAGKPEAWGSAYKAANGGTAEPETKTEWVEVALPTTITAAYTIPTPTKDGDTFIGWYENNEGTGTALTVLPVGYKGTVYAVWKSMGTSTNIENVRPALDLNTPMYDVLGRQVDTSYRGIIIQNGNKYLLR